jgi:hypothetical protein
MDRTEDHHVKLNKPVPQRQVSHVFSHMLNGCGMGGSERVTTRDIEKEVGGGRIRESNKEGEYTQSILYVYMEIT